MKASVLVNHVRNGRSLFASVRHCSPLFIACGNESVFGLTCLALKLPLRLVASIILVVRRTHLESGHAMQKLSVAKQSRNTRLEMRQMHVTAILVC
jgi:hypothetical protein